jgi:hypothetical protein
MIVSIWKRDWAVAATAEVFEVAHKKKRERYS